MYPDQPHLSHRQMGGWSCGEIGLTLHVVVISMYGLYLLTEILHQEPVKAGLILLLPRLWNILLDPWMGRMLDRRPWQKRKTLLAGALLWGGSFGLAFSLPSWWSYAHLDLAFFACLLAASTGQSMFQIPYTSMTNDLTRLDDERIRIVSLKNLVSRLTVLVTTMFFPWFMAGGSSASAHYGWLGLVLGAVIAGSALLAMTATREVLIESGAVVAGIDDSLRAIGLFRNKPYVLLLLSYGLYCLGQLPFVGLLVYYITLVMHRSPTFAIMLYPLAALASALATPVWAWLARRHGKRSMCIAAWMGSAFAWASPLWMPAGHELLFYPLMLVVGIFQAGGDLVPNVILPEVVDIGRGGGGRQTYQSTLYGIWISQQHIVLALGGVVTSLALSLTGYMPGQAGQPHAAGISLAMGLPSMLLAITAVLIMASCFKMPPKSELKLARPAIF